MDILHILVFFGEAIVKIEVFYTLHNFYQC